MMIKQVSKIIQSPLRYPGGKGSFLKFFHEVMVGNRLVGKYYYEPFAGGAGVGLGLLSLDVVAEIFLNDADYHIYSFWLALLKHNQRFVDQVEYVPLTIDEWNKQKEVYDNYKKHSCFDVGFSAFYLNRCNRSGILVGAGPIGGRQQCGEWKLDARFNKQNLIKRIMDVQNLRKRIHISNDDAIKFLKTKLPQGDKRKNILVYLDPPYVGVGSKLYLNSYEERDHKNLARYLISQKYLKWIVTYGDSDLIRQFYPNYRRWVLQLNYSLQVKQKGREILIVSESIQMPDITKDSSKKWNIKEEIII